MTGVPAPELTRAAFERECAESRGITVEELHGRGLYAEPCACGADMCRGWVLRLGVHR